MAEASVSQQARGLGSQYLQSLTCRAAWQDNQQHLYPVQVASALEKMLGAPALLVPFGQSSDACHLANERLQRINLMHGKNVIKHLLHMLEDLGSF